MDKSEHQHLHETGQIPAHTHGGYEHHHIHSPEEKKAVINRISRAIGHLQSIKTMVEDDRDCSEVLIQLSAVKSAVNNTGKLVLKEHISHCIVEAIEHGDQESLNQLNKAIDSFVK
jgi:DNA-binding FrmR family transcriptional regulator